MIPIKKNNPPKIIPTIAKVFPPYWAGSLLAFFIPRKPVIKAAIPVMGATQQHIEIIPSTKETIGKT